MGIFKGGNKEMKYLSFIYYGSIKSSFIQRDFDILNKRYNIIDTPFCSIKDIPKLLKSIIKSDISFSWFAGGHAALSVLFSKILGKPSIVILGGYEVANCPNIRYGATLNWRRALTSKFTLKYATRVLSVDESLIDEAVGNYSLSSKNMVVVPTGYNPNYFVPLGEKEDIILTVASESSHDRKGIPLFLNIAEYFPNIKFVVVGSGVKRNSKNVEFTGRVHDEELLKWYQRAKVYCQLSIHEGLPNALCEAMLCGCVPIGTPCNGIPKAIGDTGKVLSLNFLPRLIDIFCMKYIFKSEIICSIKSIIEGRNGNGKLARQRIIQLFPEQKREEELVRNVEDLITSLINV